MSSIDINELVDFLAQQIVNEYNNSSRSKRLLVGVSGVPGSGKSTLAVPLTERVNHLLASSSPIDKSKERDTAVCVGMDGWHLTRAELDAFEDPVEARRRRGAHHTFNALDFTTFVSSLADPSLTIPIPFPTFSHELKDPSPSLTPIYPSNRIVVIEGLYLFLNLPPWSSTQSLWDLKIWLDVPASLARSRLVERHLETGIESCREDAERRVDGSDMLNGVAIKENLIGPDVIVVVKEVEGGGVEFEVR